MIKAGGNIIIVASNTDGNICDVDGKVSRIRNGTYSPTVNDIFSYYASYAKSLGETNWETLFTNASKNVFPSKIYKMNENRFLTAKITQSNTQQFDCLPPTYDSIAFYYEKCKDFITNTSGAISKDDVIVEIGFEKKELEYLSGAIPPARRIAMIKIFVAEKAKLFNLSKEVELQLKEDLIGKVYIGELDEKIKKIGHTIHEIEGLVFQNGFYFIPTTPPKIINYNKKRIATTES